MRKDTMIWQTLNMVIAAMVRNKTLPENKELFEEKCIKETQGIIAYSDDEISSITHNVWLYDFGAIISTNVELKNRL